MQCTLVVSILKQSQQCVIVSGLNNAATSRMFHQVSTLQLENDGLRINGLITQDSDEISLQDDGYLE